MKMRSLLKEFDKLELEIGDYAITASGPLAVRNIREPNDLDIIVTKHLWERLSEKYPVRSERFQTIQIGNITILGTGSDFADNSPIPVTKQIQNAEIIEGHSYVNLAMLKIIKQTLGREKDLIDVEHIDKIL